MIHIRSLVVLLAVTLACAATTASAGSTLYTEFYDGTGKIVTYDTTATNPTPKTFASVGPMAVPGDLTFDPAGNLYVIKSQLVNKISMSSVEKFSTTGVDLGPITTVPAPISLLGLATDTTGNIYVSEFKQSGSGDVSSIEKFSRTGVDLGVFASTGLNENSGLAFDRAGNLYAANINNTIAEFSPTGTYLGVFASTGLNDPTRLAFDSSGNLYVTNASSPGSNNGFAGTIGRFSPTGAYLGAFASPGLNNSPFDLAFDPSGILYVTLPINNTIERYTPAGVGSSLTTSSNTAEYLAFAPTAVPEPSGLVMGCLALISLGLFACVRRQFRYVARARGTLPPGIEGRKFMGSTQEFGERNGPPIRLLPEASI